MTTNSRFDLVDARFDRRLAESDARLERSLRIATVATVGSISAVVTAATLLTQLIS